MGILLNDFLARASSPEAASLIAGTSESRTIINMSASDERHSYIQQFGRNPVYVKDEATGADDLIFDPNDPDQMAPYGCLLNAAEANRIQLPEMQDWDRALLNGAIDIGEELPHTVMLGHKDLAGGIGLGVCNDACNQANLGSCVAACGTNIVEDTVRSETIFQGLAQWWPEISIRYLYFCAQGKYSRPGGDGAMTSGLAAALMGYNEGYICKRYPELMANGFAGGVVHEAPFGGSENYPVETRGGLPYDISACRAGTPPPKAWFEMGITHRCGYGAGDIRRVRTPAQYKEVIASGHVCFTGIGWPSAWGQVDKDGFVTSGWRGGRGGHEIEFCGYMKRGAQSGYGGSNTVTRNLANGEDDWSCMKNSWGLNFGKRGYSIMPMSQMIQSGAFGELMTISFVNGWDQTVLLDLARRFRL